MKTAVIKIGGALIKNKDQMTPFWQSIRKVLDGMNVVLIHGGGPQATTMARRLSHEPTIIDGRRITSALDLNIIQWVLCGELNTMLTSQALASNLPAVGIKGIDGRIVSVVKRPTWTVNGKEIDFGLVGDIQRIDTSLLDLLLKNNLMPIVTPLGIDAQSFLYNVNADTVAQSIASALKAHLFIMVTDSGGVRKIPEQAESLLHEINKSQFDEGRSQGWIQGGMLVKLKVAFEARQSGVSEVYITRPSDIFARSKGTRVI